MANGYTSILQNLYKQQLEELENQQRFVNPYDNGAVWNAAPTQPTIQTSSGFQMPRVSTGGSATIDMANQAAKLHAIQTGKIEDPLEAARNQMQYYTNQLGHAGEEVEKPKTSVGSKVMKGLSAITAVPASIGNALSGAVDGLLEGIGNLEQGKADIVIDDILKGTVSSFLNTYKRDWFGKEDANVVSFAQALKNARERDSWLSNSIEATVSAPARMLLTGVSLGKLKGESLDNWSDVVTDIGLSFATAKWTSLAGEGKALKFLNKGEDILKANKTLDSLGDATEVARQVMSNDDFIANLTQASKKFSSTIDDAQIDDLYNKYINSAAKKLMKKAEKAIGADTTFEGLQFAGKTLLTPEKLAKIGADGGWKKALLQTGLTVEAPATILLKQSNPILNKLDDVTDNIDAFKPFKDAWSDMFTNKWMKQASESFKAGNTEDVLADVMHSTVDRTWKKNLQMHKLVALDRFEEMKDTLTPESLKKISKTMETPVSSSDELVDTWVNVDNREYFVKSQQAMEENIVGLEKKIEELKANGIVPKAAQDEIDKLTKQIDWLNNHKKSVTLSFADILENYKVPQEYTKYFKQANELRIEDLTKYLTQSGVENAENVAFKMKTAAQDVLDIMEEYSPGITKNLVGYEQMQLDNDMIAMGRKADLTEAITKDTEQARKAMEGLDPNSAEYKKLAKQIEGNDKKLAQMAKEDITTQQTTVKSRKATQEEIDAMVEKPVQTATVDATEERIKTLQKELDANYKKYTETGDLTSYNTIKNQELMDEMTQLKHEQVMKNPTKEKVNAFVQDIDRQITSARSDIKEIEQLYIDKKIDQSTLKNFREHYNEQIEMLSKEKDALKNIRFEKEYSFLKTNPKNISEEDRQKIAKELVELNKMGVELDEAHIKQINKMNYKEFHNYYGGLIQSKQNYVRSAQEFLSTNKLVKEVNAYYGSEAKTVEEHILRLADLRRNAGEIGDVVQGQTHNKTKIWKILKENKDEIAWMEQHPLKDMRDKALEFQKDPYKFLGQSKASKIYYTDVDFKYNRNTMTDSQQLYWANQIRKSEGLKEVHIKKTFNEFAGGVQGRAIAGSMTAQELLDDTIERLQKYGKIDDTTGYALEVALREKDWGSIGDIAVHHVMKDELSLVKNLSDYEIGMLRDSFTHKKLNPLAEQQINKSKSTMDALDAMDDEAKKIADLDKTRAKWLAEPQENLGQEVDAIDHTDFRNPNVKDEGVKHIKTQNGEVAYKEEWIDKGEGSKNYFKEPIIDVDGNVKVDKNGNAMYAKFDTTDEQYQMQRYAKNPNRYYDKTGNIDPYRQELDITPGGGMLAKQPIDTRDPLTATIRDEFKVQGADGWGNDMRYTPSDVTTVKQDYNFDYMYKDIHSGKDKVKASRIGFLRGEYNGKELVDGGVAPAYVGDDTLRVYVGGLSDMVKDKESELFKRLEDVAENGSRFDLELEIVRDYTINEQVPVITEQLTKGTKASVKSQNMIANIQKKNPKAFEETLTKVRKMWDADDIPYPNKVSDWTQSHVNYFMNLHESQTNLNVISYHDYKAYKELSARIVDGIPTQSDVQYASELAIYYKYLDNNYGAKNRIPVNSMQKEIEQIIPTYNTNGTVTVAGKEMTVEEGMKEIFGTESNMRTTLKKATLRNVMDNDNVDKSVMNIFDQKNAITDVEIAEQIRKIDAEEIPQHLGTKLDDTVVASIGNKDVITTDYGFELPKTTSNRMELEANFPQKQEYKPLTNPPMVVDSPLSKLQTKNEGIVREAPINRLRTSESVIEASGEVDLTWRPDGKLETVLPETKVVNGKKITNLKRYTVKPAEPTNIIPIRNESKNINALVLDMGSGGRIYIDDAMEPSQLPNILRSGYADIVYSNQIDSIGGYSPSTNRIFARLDSDVRTTINHETIHQLQKIMDVDTLGDKELNRVLGRLGNYSPAKQKQIINLIESTGAYQVESADLAIGRIADYIDTGDVTKFTAESDAVIGSIILNDPDRAQKVFGSKLVHAYTDRLANLTPVQHEAMTKLLMNNDAVQVLQNRIDVIRETATIFPTEIIAKHQKTLDELRDLISHMSLNNMTDKDNVSNMLKQINRYREMFPGTWEKHVGDVAMQIKVKMMIPTTVYGDLTKNLTDYELKIYNEVKEQFRKYGLAEGIVTEAMGDDFSNYVFHMLSEDVMLDPAKKTYVEKIFGDSFDNIFNPNSVKRKHMGTIESINERFRKGLEQEGIEPFDLFRENMAEIYFGRTLNHHKIMYDNKLQESVIRNYGYEPVRNFVDKANTRENFNEMMSAFKFSDAVIDEGMFDMKLAYQDFTESGLTISEWATKRASKFGVRNINHNDLRKFSADNMASKQVMQEFKAVKEVDMLEEVKYTVKENGKIVRIDPTEEANLYKQKLDSIDALKNRGMSEDSFVDNRAIAALEGKEFKDYSDVLIESYRRMDMNHYNANRQLLDRIKFYEKTLDGVNYSTASPAQQSMFKELWDMQVDSNDIKRKIKAQVIAEFNANPNIHYTYNDVDVNWQKAYKEMSDFKVAQGDYVRVIKETPKDFRKYDVLGKGAFDIDDLDIDPENVSGFKILDDQYIKSRTFDVNNDRVIYIKRGQWETYQKVLKENLKKDKNAFVEVFDKFQSMYKAMALFSGRFLSNSVFNNALESYMTAGTNLLSPKYMKMYADFIKGNDFEVAGFSAAELRVYLDQGNALATDTTNLISKSKPLMNAVGQEVKEQSIFQKLNLFNTDNMFYQGVFKAKEHAENSAKFINVVTHLEKGMSIEDSIELANKALFDYGDATKFENTVLKRILPFYTFTRKTIPLQIENFANNPGKMRAVLNVQQKMSERLQTDQERRLVPDYLQNALAIGGGKFLNLKPAYLELEKIFQPSSSLSMLSPFIKTPAELALNKKLFSGAEVSRYNDPKEKMEYAVESFLPFFSSMSRNLKKASEGDYTYMANFLGFPLKEYDKDKAMKQAFYDYVQQLEKQYYQLLEKDPGAEARIQMSKDSQKAQKTALQSMYNVNERTGKQKQSPFKYLSK